MAAIAKMPDTESEAISSSRAKAICTPSGTRQKNIARK
jgi:hypothetical protein